MTRPSQDVNRLLLLIEDGISSASDREVLSYPRAAAVAKIVRGIIGEELSNSHVSKKVLPATPADRRRLLDLVIGSRATLPSEIRMAYAKSNKISDPEVSALLDKLLRLGLLTNFAPTRK